VSACLPAHLIELITPAPRSVVIHHLSAGRCRSHRSYASVFGTSMVQKFPITNMSATCRGADTYSGRCTALLLTRKMNLLTSHTLLVVSGMRVLVPRVPGHPSGGGGDSVSVGVRGDGTIPGGAHCSSIRSVGTPDRNGMAGCSPACATVHRVCYYSRIPAVCALMMPAGRHSLASTQILTITAARRRSRHTQSLYPSLTYPVSQWQYLPSPLLRWPCRVFQTSWRLFTPRYVRRGLLLESGPRRRHPG